MRRKKTKSLDQIRKVAFRFYEKKNIPYYRLAYRTVAIHLVYVLQFLPVTPNMVSFGASLITVLAGLFFIKHDILLFFIGVALLYFGESLDYADGTLARAQKKTTKMVSVFLDVFFHEIPRQFIFFFIGLGGYMTTNNPLFFYMGVTVLISQLLTMHLAQLRKAVVATYTNIEFINERDDNPFIKSRIERFALEIIVFPMKQNKLILLFAVILTYWIPYLLYYMLYFYAPYVMIRYIAFFFVTYKGVKKIEEEMKSKLK